MILLGSNLTTLSEKLLKYDAPWGIVATRLEPSLLNSMLLTMWMLFPKSLPPASLLRCGTRCLCRLFVTVAAWYVCCWCTATIPSASIFPVPDCCWVPARWPWLPMLFQSFSNRSSIAHWRTIEERLENDWRTGPVITFLWLAWCRFSPFCNPVKRGFLLKKMLKKLVPLTYCLTAAVVR